MSIKKIIKESKINFNLALKGRRRAQLILEVKKDLTSKEQIDSIVRSLSKTLKGKIKIKKIKIKEREHKITFCIRVKVKRELSYKESFSLLYGKLQSVAFMLFESISEGLS